MNTTANEVFQYFETYMRDKEVIPESLELHWLKRAVARYSLELEPISFDEETEEFNEQLDNVVIDTLAAMMVQMYQHRQVSKVNKRASIVTKDISLDTVSNTKTAEKNLLDYDTDVCNYMVHHQKEPAYN